MPKVAKNVVVKKGGVGGGGAKKNKLYSMPEKIPEGTILSDKLKRSWRVGKSIGLGGFGEIYSASKEGESNYDYVVKCEPNENGPLFVEMHFYMRNGKEADLEEYKKKRGLKSLGMPHMISNGTLSLNSIDHRYIVMPRYGKSVEHYFLANGRHLPTGTVYRLAIQMLDVYEYLHQCGYVHADLKAANILVGLGRTGTSQAFLIDFGLASRYFIDREYKCDPKKAHNGTIEYTSRDAHNGVPTTRGDLEILGYNLIQWLGGELPWVYNKILTVPKQVQAAKEKFMSNVNAELGKLFPQSVPAPLAEYMNYVAKLQYNDRMDFKKCHKIFQDGLKALKISDNGELIFTMKTSATKIASKSPTRKRLVQRKRPATSAAVENSEEDDDAEQERNASDDNDNDVVLIGKPNKRNVKPGTLKLVTTPTRKEKLSPKKSTPRRATPNSASPRKRPSLRATTATSPSPIRKKLKTTPPSSSRRATPLSARANININPKITLAQKTVSSLASRHGSTVVNNNVTPNPRANKTYEFNVELNVSMDADVIVNVKRKKKTPTNGTAQSPKATPTSSSRTPVVLVKKTKISSEKRN